MYVLFVILTENYRISEQSEHLRTDIDREIDFYIYFVAMLPFWCEWLSIIYLEFTSRRRLSSTDPPTEVTSIVSHEFVFSAKHILCVSNCDVPMNEVKNWFPGYLNSLILFQ